MKVEKFKEDCTKVGIEPGRVRDAALYFGHSMERFLQIIEASATAFQVVGSFVWSTSLEGRLFWVGIYDKLVALEQSDDA